MAKNSTPKHFGYINLTKLSKTLIIHGGLLITVSLFDLGYFLWFLIMVIIENNSGKYMGEAGWGLLILWMALINLLPFALIALYYLIRGIRFIWTGNHRTYKNTPLNSRYFRKAQHSAILQMALLTIEILCILFFVQKWWLQFIDFGVILPIFIILRIVLLLETVYFYTQLCPPKGKHVSKR